jgi:predicted metalloprotease
MGRERARPQCVMPSSVRHTPLVDFDDGVRLDTSQVRDRRGGGRGVALGGGGLGLVGLLLAVVLGVNPADLLSDSGAAPADGAVTDLDERCRTGADAERDSDCRTVALANSIQDYWSSALRDYQEADTVLFSGRTSSGCGPASSQTGPFYCPADGLIYLDLSFFTELSTTYGANDGAFAQAYVIAHEYGHHVQNLLGVHGDGGQGATSQSVRVELQADCYAGIWAHHAAATGYLTRVTDQDIRDGLSAAAAVGDDRIQREFNGSVDEGSFTHGTSAQRQKWFTTGYRTGTPRSCDTFTGRI